MESGGHIILAKMKKRLSSKVHEDRNLWKYNAAHAEPQDRRTSHKTSVGKPEQKGKATPNISSNKSYEMEPLVGFIHTVQRHTETHTPRQTLKLMPVKVSFISKAQP